MCEVVPCKKRNDPEQAIQDGMSQRQLQTSGTKQSLLLGEPQMALMHIKWFWIACSYFLFHFLFPFDSRQRNVVQVQEFLDHLDIIDITGKYF